MKWDAVSNILKTRLQILQSLRSIHLKKSLGYILSGITKVVKDSLVVQAF